MQAQVVSVFAYCYTDSYGLLRAAHSRNPTPYSHTAKLARRFYAHIVACPKVMKPLLCKHKWFPYSHTAIRIPTDCYVLRTLAILHNIRISRSLRFTFMLILWRVPRS
ncbi:MAG: hypothetical protein E7288_01130 [Lachnospiraceae bacterium]|nr:hypothetical protein [Lachnospiraceae bacterium]